MSVQINLPRQVQDVMTHEVVTLTPPQPFTEALVLLARHRFRHLVVTETDARLAGVISDRDMLRFMSSGADLKSATVADVMWHEVVTIRPETLLSEATGQMLSRRINCLPVVDENERLCGILTSTDLLQAFQRMQERVEQESATPQAGE